MFKKLLLLIIIVGLIIGGMYAYQEVRQKSVISATLSARSKEFLENQSKKEGTSWRFTNVDNKDDVTVSQRNQRISIGGCFSLIVPFPVRTHYTDTVRPCQEVIAIEAGNVIAYQEDKGEKIESFDGVSGVHFRRLNADRYEEKQITANDRTFLLFTSKEPGRYETNAFYYQGSTEYIISLYAGGDPKELDKKLVQMLETVEFNKQ